MGLSLQVLSGAALIEVGVVFPDNETHTHKA